MKNRDKMRLPCPDCSGDLVLIRKPKKWKGPSKWAYACENRSKGCRATCTAHPDGSPAAVPAPRAVRKARSEAHVAFDVLWQENCPIKRQVRFRNICYAYIADKMVIPYEECHIGMMGIERLKEFTRISKETSAADVWRWAQEVENRNGPITREDREQFCPTG